MAPSLRTALSGLILAASLAAASAAPAGDAQSTLICHTADPDDCYPRTFAARRDFQPVHDDQELPPGLHVRINLQTGAKEAKLNVPGELDPALEGLPVDDASVVVVPPARDADAAPPLPSGAPAYDPVGKVKEPERDDSSFVAAMDALREPGVGRAPALAHHLEHLEELSHDIYYGLKMANDTCVVRALLCLVVGAPGARDGALDQQAALVLAGALQNNPSALEKVAGAWSDLMAATCPDTGATTIGQALYPSLSPSRNPGPGRSAASRVKAKLSAVNGLLKHAAIRAEFLGRGGMERLLEVLVVDDTGDWAAAQRRAGQLVLDNFLDADMGATLGLWPWRPRLTDEQCRSDALRTAEGC